MFGFKNILFQSVIFLVWITQNYTFGSEILWHICTYLIYANLVLCVLMYDYDYWVNRGVFSPPALPVVGHIGPVVAGKEQGGICFKKIYDKYKDKKILGIHQFFRRTLVICDPELIKRVCVNDFMYFTDRGFFFDKELDPLAGSVLYLRGNEWKKLRAKISPIFSPIKLKGMLPIIENTANEFVLRIQKLLTEANNEKSKESNAIEKECNNNDNKSAVVNSDELVGGYTADAIVPCAFGVKSHVMDNANDPFAVALGAFYELSFFNIFEKMMRHLWPAFVLFFKMKTIPKKTHDFFYNIVTNVIKDRKNGVQEKRGDFIDMMMALRNEDRTDPAEKENEVKITDMVIAANAFIIFLGGYETTSSTLAFMFLELAAHQEIQETVRDEIKEAYKKHGGKMSSEMLQDLTYMDMVIQEILRLYPPFPTIQRMCTKDYHIPGTDVVLAKGTIVVFPTLGLHRDDQYFPDAESFRPSRWRAAGADAGAEAGAGARAGAGAGAAAGVYAPFGDGPRYCVGKRFALNQMKCCLVKLLTHVRITPATKVDERGRTFVEPRTRPFDVDIRAPMTLHPADSRVTLSLL
nr:cytochrome P450 6B5-like [Vanessa tameamea]